MSKLSEMLGDLISTMDESRRWQKLGDELPTMSAVGVLAIKRAAEKSDNFSAKLLVKDCNWHIKYRLSTTDES